MSGADPFFEAILSNHAQIDGQVLQLGASTWALSGFIAYDGDVILAEYDDPASAQQALNRIPIRDIRTEDTP
jgi:hypothetical protein